MSEAKKLRALVPACDDPSDYTEDDRVMLEAADRIEALEAALQLCLEIAREGIHSREMLMSNPPQNLVAYRVMQEAEKGLRATASGPTSG